MGVSELRKAAKNRKSTIVLYAVNNDMSILDVQYALHAGWMQGVDDRLHGVDAGNCTLYPMEVFTFRR